MRSRIWSRTRDPWNNVSTLYRLSCPVNTVTKHEMPLGHMLTLIPKNGSIKPTGGYRLTKICNYCHNLSHTGVKDISNMTCTRTNIIQTVAKRNGSNDLTLARQISRHFFIFDYVFFFSLIRGWVGTVRQFTPTQLN